MFSKIVPYNKNELCNNHKIKWKKKFHLNYYYLLILCFYDLKIMSPIMIFILNLDYNLE